MEIEKGIDDEIIKYLHESKFKYTNLSSFIDNSKYNFSEFYEILKDLVKEDIIEPKNKKGFYSLILTKKGKLAVDTELIFKLTEKGHLRLRNDLYNLNEKSINIQEDKNNTNKGKTSILQKVYWVIGIISTLLIINFTINEQFGLNIIKWVINKF